MTREQIAALLEHIDELPQAAQDEILRSIEAVVQEHREVYELDPEERADVREALGEIERGEAPASEDEVEAVFRKYGA